MSNWVLVWLGLGSVLGGFVVWLLIGGCRELKTLSPPRENE